MLTETKVAVLIAVALAAGCQPQAGGLVATQHADTVAQPGDDGFHDCTVDADCVAVPQVGCCFNGWLEAVNLCQVDAYEFSFTCPNPNPVCPQFLVDDRRVAECNNATHKCEMVNITKIQCGSFIANSHECPDAYACKHQGVPDLAGICVPRIPCGGNTTNAPTCPDGYHCQHDGLPDLPGACVSDLPF